MGEQVQAVLLTVLLTVLAIAGTTFCCVAIVAIVCLIFGALKLYFGWIRSRLGWGYKSALDKILDTIKYRKDH